MSARNLFYCKDKTFCFDGCGRVIRQHVETKVARYRENDSNLRFQTRKVPAGEGGIPLTKRQILAANPTADVNYFVELLIKSEGLCTVCKTPLILHNWSKLNPRQFSFDRLDDTLPHCVGNLQVSCYKCNSEKAAADYQPVRGVMFDLYNKGRFVLNKMEKDYPFIGNSLELQSAEELVITSRHHRLRAYVAHLHNEVYGNRKNNGWIVPNEFAPTGVLNTLTLH